MASAPLDRCTYGQCMKVSSTRLALRFVCCVLLLVTSGCSAHSPSEETARLFLDQYLVAADQKAAIELATGRARVELQKEIDLLASVEEREQMLLELSPRVHFEKVYEKYRSGGDVAYLFKVEIDRQGVSLEPRDVFLLVGETEVGWRIKSFSFRAPSDSRTSDTP